MPDLIRAVSDLLRQCADEVVVPLFGSPDARPTQKGPGDWVTVADHESEAMLSWHLPLLWPGSMVVGEEAVHADPAILDRLGGDEPVWLIDPVDGTRNYAAGKEPFAMIVALVQEGVTTCGWIYLPMEHRMLVARRGRGAWLNGVPQHAPQDLPRRLRGIMPLPALPAETADDVVRRSEPVADLLPSHWCSGREYPDVVAGGVDFALATTTWPWDHAAGALAVTEMGGRAAYFDGEPYSVLDTARRGTIFARSPAIWEVVRRDVLPPDMP